MCGIAGFIGKKAFSPKVLSNTLALMNNRGPDYHGLKKLKTFKSNLYFLHSRLGIIDLNKRSNQPFVIDDYVLIFNGEIYNYLEIKKALIKKGHKFTTNSDTEVLLRSYIEYGEDCVKHFNGMWSFAIWDTKKKILIISRDRFGEKPLYFYQSREGFYFASEIKFIFSLLGKRLSVNYNQCFRFLINGYKSIYKSSENFFKKINEVPPGCFLIIDHQLQKRIQRYWVPTFNQDQSLTYEEIVEKTRLLMIKSVELRMRSDVPIAFCMSGGVDSNSIISIANKLLKKDVHGFTIINKDHRYDEECIIDEIIKTKDISHTKIHLNTKEFLPNLKKLILYHDAPISTISNYASWLLHRSIKECGFKISISGVGADELFSGYLDHHLFYFHDIKNDQSLLNDSIYAWKKYILPNIRNPFLKNAYYILDSPNSREHIYLNSEKFSKYLNKNWSEPFDEVSYSEDLLRNRMANEIFHEVVPVILHEDDLNAMYFSIENRSPFLDHNLFEFCQNIPTKFLMKNGFSKIVLRDALKGHLHEKVSKSYKKVGFNAPISSFLDLNDRKIKDYLLDDGPIFDFLNKGKIESLLNKTLLTNSFSKFLFNFLNIKIFTEEFSS